jgi:hypothetical protein
MIYRLKQEVDDPSSTETSPSNAKQRVQNTLLTNFAQRKMRKSVHYCCARKVLCLSQQYIILSIAKHETRASTFSIRSNTLNPQRCQLKVLAINTSLCMSHISTLAATLRSLVQGLLSASDLILLITFCGDQADHAGPINLARAPGPRAWRMTKPNGARLTRT